ncbi:MAG: nucleotide-binding protein [Candidatus Omnitrophica bacterium]|nr:nucleotide-binding protein [Candidatus Omnitrophota bacterium]
MTENIPDNNNNPIPEEKQGGPAEKPLGELRFTPEDEIVEKGGRVCITYGRDQIMNKQVVSLIRQLGIDPVLMQDKNNKSVPVAQFFTEHKDISFVIAILSADDWVYPKNAKPNDALLYADQGVVFHLGFWIGRLGRNRVFALYYDQRSFRWPTEHFDVIYTPLDKNGSWKKELETRLNASGIQLKKSQQ